MPLQKTVTGWYDGLTEWQVEQGAVDVLRRRQAFLLEWWGLTPVPSGDQGLTNRLELGDRATRDLVSENSNSLTRLDWVISKALSASPQSFSTLLGQPSLGQVRSGDDAPEV
jgi:hypothetical protein